MIEWIKNLFRNEVRLTVWFYKDSSTSPEGVQTVTRKKKVFKLKRIVKITSTHVLAEDLYGNKLEFKTTEPFDYFIETIF